MLGSNFLLFSLIILTIWLPGNLLINLIIFNYPVPESTTFRLSGIIEGLFGPIYVGALIYALAQRKRGRMVGYFEALSVGLHRWGRLFGTRFFTGWIILLGLIALIVPGIIFLIQYALIDPIVVLEGKGGPEARRRSKELTKGKRWQIFWAGILFFGTVLPLMIGIHAVVGELELITNVATAVAVDCATDILYSAINILMFLFYWEAIRLEEAGLAGDEIGDELTPSRWLTPQGDP